MPDLMAALERTISEMRDDGRPSPRSVEVEAEDRGEGLNEPPTRVPAHFIRCSIASIGSENSISASSVATMRP